ncbi:MAG: hypothetical protein WCS86_03745 [Candidatus Paceibacterota bacterium]
MKSYQVLVFLKKSLSKKNISKSIGFLIIITPILYLTFLGGSSHTTPVVANITSPTSITDIESEAVLDPFVNEVWITPNPYYQETAGTPLNRMGGQDLLTLFNSTSSWQNALNDTSTFGVFLGFISDQYNGRQGSFKIEPNLAQQIIQTLKDNNKPISLQTYPLYKCSSYLTENTLSEMQLISSLGGNIKYILPSGGDGSLFYAIKYCNVTIDNAVKMHIGYVNEIHKSYPDVIVGEIFPTANNYSYASSTDQVISILDAYKQNNGGKELPLIELEMIYQPYSSATRNYSIDYGGIKRLQTVANERGIKFGIILQSKYYSELLNANIIEDKDTLYYNGIMEQVSDLKNNGIRPDFVDIMSWFPYPQISSPDSLSPSFMNLVTKVKNESCARDSCVPKIAPLVTIVNSTTPKTLNAKQSGTFSWSATSSTPDMISWNINWGDGSSTLSKENGCTDSSCLNFSSAHTWTTPGTYTITAKASFSTSTSSRISSVDVTPAIIQKCLNGTPYGSCVTYSQPKYCSTNGTIINQCQTCGCPSGYSCKLGSCLSKTPGSTVLPAK